MALLHAQGTVQYSTSLQDGQSVQYWLSQASVHRSQGEFEKSLAAIKKAFQFSPQISSAGFSGRCLIRMGILEWNLGDIEESARKFGEARAVFKKALDPRSQEFCAKCLELVQFYNEGKDARLAKLYYRSIQRFERACSIGREIGIEDLALKCLRQQAVTYLEMRRLDLFLDNCKKGLDISIRISHGIEQARCSNNIGIYYQQRSSYSQAVGYFEKALSILRFTKDPATEAECLNNLGLVYRELGNLDRAQFLLSRALALDQKYGNATSICLDLENLGSVFLRKGIENGSRDDLNQALGLFQRGLSLLERGRADPRITFAALNNIGISFIELKDLEGARRYLRRALAVVKDDDQAIELCQVLNNIAVSHMDERNIDEALAYFQRSHAIGSKHSYENVLMECCYGLGQCYEMRQDDSSALSFYRKSIEALERLRGRIPAEPFSIGFSRNKFGAYERAIHLLAARHTRQASGDVLADLFDLIERAKARAFLENAQEALADGAVSDRWVLKERQQAISRNIKELSSKIAGHPSSREEEEALVNELEMEEDEYVRLISETKVQEDNQEERWRKSIRGVTEIQGMLLSEDAVLLEYYLGEPSSYLLRISPHSIRLYRLPARGEVEASLRAYLRFISDRSLDSRAGIVPAERIGRELMPLERDESFNRAKSLLVIPDGVLHHLPFEALRIPDGSGSKYLIENYSVSYCPSASSLMLLKNAGKPGKWNKALLAIGGPEYDPNDVYGGPAAPRRQLGLKTMRGKTAMQVPSLPFSKKEVLDVAQQFPARMSDVLTGESASETRLKTMTLMDYQIIHFACHGALDERFPSRSALILSSSNTSEDDGLLQTREIYGLSMNAGMVVLSACHTAKGRLEKTEGPMALTRPFFFAGARSIIASLWPISDKATVFFMHEFYRNLVLGRSKNESLRYAKIKMLESSWGHPYYWASFMLQGDPSPLTMTR
jgi:CHAT domain-containing protein/Tfp pilus assembly protein PilF